MTVFYRLEHVIILDTSSNFQVVSFLVYNNP